MAEFTSNMVAPPGKDPDKRIWKKESFAFILCLALGIAAEFIWLAATTANSFSDIRTSLFRNPTWTEDPKVSKNPLDFWCHTGTAETISLF